MQVIFRAMFLLAFLSGIGLAGEAPALEDEKGKISYSVGRPPRPTT
jgi:hypothetical protein